MRSYYDTVQQRHADDLFDTVQPAPRERHADDLLAGQEHGTRG
eukprot:CAMPEP_0198495368 /NCGR_PEP_ID=MMETSP1462-20131121/5167_1 /TAXON_ID=1333877 /ORGANISM="Brandtodinium nutriculum, Strain RCC3387" /LENGTH=42 /DNA_ID= /DNA_START= /DNA_END= /DNA_ORIENTATION=